MEQIVDAFSNSDGSVRFETAGASQGGKQVWALLYLDEPFQIKGDPSQTLPFIALLNRHDGTGAMAVVRTQVRVVCWNTFQMAAAEGKRTGLTYSFRHMGDPRTRIEEAKLALSGLRSEVEAYREMAETLSERVVTSSSLEQFLSDFLPDPSQEGHPVSDRVKSNIYAARRKFKEIYETSTTTDEIRGNGYGLLQTATEYLDHVRGYRTNDTYIGRSVLGGDYAKRHVLKLVKQHSF